MPRKKLPYKEGDWFAVPLEERGYAIGLVARSRKNGRVLFGYFFGPSQSKPSILREIENLKPEDAILVGQFGDLGLYEGEWPIIGSLENWNREKWPMPLFARIDDISNTALKVKRSEDDPNEILNETPCSLEEAYQLPKESLMGSGAVEIRLSMLLSAEKVEKASA